MVNRTVHERMANAARAELLSPWRAGQESIDLPVDEEVHRLGRRIADPTDVLIWIDADVTRHDADYVPRRSEARGHANLAALQIGNATNVIVSEQLEASDVHTGYHCQRRAAIQLRDNRGCEIHGPIHFVASDHLRRRQHVRSYIPDLGKALRMQQFLGHVPAAPGRRPAVFPVGW